MARPSRVPLDFRPATYWDTPETILVNVKGEHRRRLIQHALTIGTADALDEWLRQDQLDDADRDAIGRIHPMVMGGEYPPDYQFGEVEIARPALDSTLGDVISIRARREGDVITYRVVDEYGQRYTCTPTSSALPLTTDALIGLIDSARVTSDDDADDGANPGFQPEDFSSFITVSAPFCEPLGTYSRARGRAAAREAATREAGQS